MKWPKTFDLDNKETSPEPVATPDNAPNIGSVIGTPLEEVKATAREVAATPSQVISPGPKGSAARKQIAKEKQDQEDKENAAAIEVTGKIATRKLAGMPYRVWAFLASDPSLALNPDEQRELSDAYFQLIKAMKPNMNKPVWILGTIALLNFDMVAVRMQKKLSQTEEGRRILEQFPEIDASKQ